MSRMDDGRIVILDMDLGLEWSFFHSPSLGNSFIILVDLWLFDAEKDCSRGLGTVRG